MTDETFGQLIRRRRNEAGLILVELGERCGIGATYLSKIENGKVPPPALYRIHSLSVALRIDTDELVRLAAKEREPLYAQLEAENARLRAALDIIAMRTVGKPPMFRQTNEDGSWADGWHITDFTRGQILINQRAINDAAQAALSGKESE